MAPKPKTAPVRAQPSKAAAKPTGLQLSSAQWKAYTAAYTASATAGYRKLAIQAAAQSLRKSRLNAAYSIGKKAAAAHAAARTAAIAAFAARMSFRQSQQAHQNQALRNRVYAGYQRHVQAASRLQYAYKGEKVYLHTAVMNTLTTAQAVSTETVRFAQAVKTAKKAVKSVSTPGASTAKQSPASAQVQAAAKAAGLAAAKKVPAGRTAPRPADVKPGLFVPRAYGDPAGYDCVAAAVANHLLYATGMRIGRRSYYALADALGDRPSIADALELTMKHPPWGYDGPLLAAYVPVVYPLRAVRKTVVGVCSPEGAHAAVALETGALVCWGELLPLAEVCVPGTGIEEAWDLLWVLPRVCSVSS